MYSGKPISAMHNAALEDGHMPRTLMHDGLFLEFSPGADAEAFLRRCERHVEAALDERVHLAIKAPPEPQCLPALVAQMDSEFSIQNNKLEDAGALALFFLPPLASGFGQVRLVPWQPDFVLRSDADHVGLQGKPNCLIA
mmetsp:Transcript_15701/g.38436  ORF Transcript_15701/g.38436 Transcript_15701/m.38436 type:complete len:140 (+) Transcript_15701:2162-2581(+)